MPKTILYCDCDGVLADFAGTCLDAFGIDSEKNRHRLTHWNALTDVVQEDLGIPPDQAWDMIQAQPDTFWRDMRKEIYFDCVVDLMQEMRNNGAEVFLLTSPMKSGSNCYPRMDWVKSLLPDWVYDERRVIFAHHKYLLARPGDLLIDDKRKNVRLWDKSGGTGILVPQPWSVKDCCDDHSYEFISKIRQMVNELVIRTSFGY